MLERLDAMDRVFERALIIGAPTGQMLDHPKIRQGVLADLTPQRLPSRQAPSVILDEEWLPITPQSLDVVISVMSLHHINDLPGAMVQIRQALRPDGLFLAVLPGARTLWELREALAHAESVSGGLSPRIAPFTEVRDAGGLLQRAGFALPVIDSELLTLSYETMFHLMQELKGMGEGNVLHERLRHPTSRAIFLQAAQHYASQYSDEEGRITATVELLCLTAWTPHPSQQQPAKRGSGQVNLARFFEEGEAGEST